MKISKLFTTLFISGIIFLPNKISNGCADSWDEDQVFLRPFNQDLVDLPDYQAFYYSWHYWNGFEYPSPLDDRSENISDWVAYFKNRFTAGDIELAFYPSTYADYIALDDYFQKNKKPSNEALILNPVVKYWKGGAGTASFNYMFFAKSVEPNVQEPDWWEPAPRDEKLMTSLKESAKRRMQDEQDPDLKLRYCYQAMRMAHYTKQYDECIALYDQNVEKINSNSVIKYWCLSLKAGAYWRENKFAESSYYNALVFDKCPSRRLCSERDFYIPDQNTWNKCLSMCKTTREKSTLWLLTGINQNNSALPALHTMLKTDPSFEGINLLLSREVEKLQRTLMPSRDDLDLGEKNDYDDYARPDSSNNAKDILAFIDEGINTNKINNPAFWEASGAFVSFLNADNKACDEYAKKATIAAAGNKEMLDQVHIIQVLNKTAQLTEINPRIETSLLPDIKWLAEYEEGTPKEDAYRFCLFMLARVYAKQGELIKAELCKSQYASYYDIYDHVTKAPVDELFAYLQNTHKTEFETFLGDKYPYNADNMLEIKGTLYMQQHEWQKAIATFTAMESPETIDYFQLPTDPFLNNINDCHDCDFEHHPADYTKQSLAEKIIDLETKLKSNPKNKAEICNMLGNAYYNISYYGNSWMALKYYRCHTCIEYEDSDWNYGEPEFYDCSKALEYYKLAASSTKDKEFAALNTYMAAKCEQNTYYNSKDYTYDNEKGLKNKYRTNFAIFKKNYADTKFYQEAINECGYFDYFVKHN